MAETLPVEEIFIFPAMGDDGLAVGAALCYLRDRDGLAAWLAQRRRLDNVYLGQDFDAQIDMVSGGRIRRPAACPAIRSISPPTLVEAGEAGAIFVGRMEYGPRALGARSIIASPTRSDN